MTAIGSLTIFPVIDAARVSAPCSVVENPGDESLPDFALLKNSSDCEIEVPESACADPAARKLTHAMQ
jgi:hypothetical protein